MVAVIKGAEVSDAALEVMQSYYDQLGCLETKIPFSQAKIYFKWLDAFDKGGWLGGAVAYTMSTSLLYEKACVLFNVAAISTKLAAHAKVLYLQTNLGLGRENVRGMWERDWMATMEQRASLCRGLAELHQASVCQEQGKWGERIARLRVAKASLASVPEWFAKADTALAEAVKDNEFIYHEREPDAEQLEPVAAAAVVKATPLPERWRPGEADLFREMPVWADVKLKREECVVS